MQLKTFFFFFSFLIIFNSQLFAQEAVEELELETELTAEIETEARTELSLSLPAIEHTRTPMQLEIAEITVSGAEHFDDFVLVGFSGLSVGQIISVPGDEITDATRRFWRQGLFADVKIGYTKIEDNKIWLHIALQQRPRISEVNFHGLRNSEVDDLRPRVGLIVGNQITRNLSDRAARVINRVMEEKGFANAEVRVLQRNDPNNPGHVIVDIEVDKNLRTRVHSVNITGNEALSFNQINRAMRRTNAPHWTNIFRTKRFVREEFENDKASLIERYNQAGFRDAYIVEYSVVPHDERSVRIYLTVDEGNRYYFRNISWIGNTIFPHEFLSEVLGIQRGDVYNRTLLMERLFSGDDAISGLYQNRGYLFSNVEAVEVMVDGDSIDFEIRIFEGRPATINMVNIIGNDRVYEHVIRRELWTKPGQLYSQAAVIRTLRELAQMGHFDQEQLFADFQNGGISPNPEDGTVDLNFVLQTRGSDQVEFSLGWGIMGVVGSVGLRFTNFAIQNLFRPEMYRIVPQGEGQVFSINARTNGQFYNSIGVSFVEPWLGGRRPNSLSVSVHYSAQSRVSDRWNQFFQDAFDPRFMGGMGGMGMGMGGMGMGMGGMGMGMGEGMLFEIDPESFMRVLGVSVGYGQRLNWPDNFFTFFGEVSYQLFMMQNWWQILFPLGDGNFHALSLNLTLGRNSTDNPLFTRSGSAFSLGVQVTPPFSLFRGNPNSYYASYYETGRISELYARYNFLEFHKWRFNARTFTPLTPNEKLILMKRAEFGFLGHYNRYLRSPIGTFVMGGDGMAAFMGLGEELVAMRGYESGSLTPFDPMWGAHKGFLFNRFTLELRYPLLLEQTVIWALAFVEAGNSFNGFRNYNPFDLKRSAGVGVRLFLPMFGLMGIDWAYGFDNANMRPGRSGSQFHFVLGHEL